MANKETEEEKKARKEAERLAKEQAKKEAEEAKKAKKEAERLAKEQSKKEKEAKKLAKEQAKQEKEAKKQAKLEPAQDISSATYEGEFQLVLPSSAGFKQVKQFTDRLAGIQALKIAWTGGSEDEGTIVAVSVAQPIPLASVISEMPMVEGVEVKGGKIKVILQASA